MGKYHLEHGFERGNGVMTNVNCPNQLEPLLAQCDGSKLRRMSDQAEERAALLALLEERPTLRGERAGKTAWSTIASEVAMLGSAIRLWEQFHPPVADTAGDMLALEGIQVPNDDADLMLAQALRTVRGWEESTEFDVMTVLNDDYPVALREIHQMPPLLFTRGHLRADEIGVSIVGTREPTAAANPSPRTSPKDLYNGGSRSSPG